MTKVIQTVIAAALFMGATVFSAPTAACADWGAEWIGAPWDGEEYSYEEILPAPELRKNVDIAKKVSSATVRISGLGLFELSINGVKVGDEVLSPNETSYSHRDAIRHYGIPMDDTNWRHFRVLYLTYEVKDYLKKGGNELSVLLGNGFYANANPGMNCPYGTPRMICRLDISYTDGTSETIVSDSSWEVRRSPIVLNDFYRGEIYDARLEGKGEWEPAVVRKAPDGELMPADGVPDKVVEILKPKTITKLDDGRWEVDFGDYITGWIRLNDFKAPEGSEISIEFISEERGNGVYKYIADGSKVKSYAPKFTWWAFNRIILSGWEGSLKPSNLRAEVVHSDVKENAEFSCSNDLINRICRIWKRTQTDNMHLGCASDCPHRERLPYTGDGEASCVAVLHNYDARAFYRKWLHDMSDVQDTVTGYVPNAAPWHPGCGGGVAWGAAMCIIPWEYYLRYGDSDVLAENYFPMKEQVRHMLSWRRADGTMLQQLAPNGGEPIYWMNLGEWCPPYGLPSENLVHTWYLWRCASYTAKAAKALGNNEDYEYYSALAEDVAKAFHKAFYDSEAKSYRGGSGILDASGYGTGDGNGAGDGSNIFALAMGVPAECREDVIATVKAELEANDNHLNTGIYGTGLFFEVLCDAGLSEEAYEAMTKTDFPSFGWWIVQGAQTTWEQWNGKNSRNHPMFGGALVWLYRKVVGVIADENAPGYKHTIIKPTPVGDLRWARYSTETEYGKLSVRWTRRGSDFRLRVIVPEETTATVYLPDNSAPQTLTPGRHTLRCRIQPLS